MCADLNSKDQPGSSRNLGRNVPIPTFIHDQPTVWVGLLEGWFKLNRITDDEDRFYFALTALPAEVAVDFLDFATRPPAKNAFALLRSALIERLGLSDKQRLHQLLKCEELGDRRPSQLLRSMQQHAGIMKIDTPLLREMFLERLPINIQAGLATASANTSVEELAQIADRIAEVKTDAPTIAVVTAAPVIAHISPPTTMDQVLQRLARVEQELAELRLDYHRNANEPPETRGRAPFYYGRSAAPNPDHCFYHQQFKQGAINCKQPCSFSKNGPARQ